MHSIVQSSTIEGIDAYARKYENCFKTISLKPYDPLDHRKPYFDADYDKFINNTVQVDNELKMFFYQFISRMPNITQALWMMER